MVGRPRGGQVTGQAPGESLASLLNQDPTQLDRQTFELQHKLRGLFTGLPLLLARLQAMLPGEASPPEMSKTLKGFNDFLRDCAEHPEIFIVHPAPGTGKTAMLIQEFARANPGTARAEACAAICALVRYQLLDRVRQCVRCSKWFFAKKSDSRYCSRECQKQSTEEYRRSKREYAKLHYKEQQKSQKAKHKTKGGRK